MSAADVWIPLALYLPCVLFFFYMAAEVFLRNPKKIEHRLVAVTSLCYMLLMLAEWVRHLLPISQSPIIATFWFANIGIAIPGFGFHFVAKFSGLDKRMPRWLYPYCFYALLLLIPMNFWNSAYSMAVGQYQEVGFWKYPEYHTSYYLTMIFSILTTLIYLVVLAYGRKKARSSDHRKVYDILLIGVGVVAAWHIVFGLFTFRGFLPPYPYIFGGIFWCVALRLAMKKYDFLDYNSKKYEKLFNLNPAAILLAEIEGRVKEANPSARRMFDQVQLSRSHLGSLAGERLYQVIRKGEPIDGVEGDLHNGNRRIEAVIDGDYVWLDNEPHIILIVRDLTQQREQQRTIRQLLYSDELTGLPNRHALEARWQHEALRAQEHGDRLALIVITISGIEEYCRSRGWHEGDQLVCRLADLMQTVVAGSGLLMRLREMQFAVLIAPVPSDEFIQDTVRLLDARLNEAYARWDVPIRHEWKIGYCPDDGMVLAEILGGVNVAISGLPSQQSN